MKPNRQPRRAHRLLRCRSLRTGSHPASKPAESLVERFCGNPKFMELDFRIACRTVLRKSNSINFACGFGVARLACETSAGTPCNWHVACTVAQALGLAYQ